MLNHRTRGTAKRCCLSYDHISGAESKTLADPSRKSSSAMPITLFARLSGAHYRRLSKYFFALSMKYFLTRSSLIYAAAR
jgi:hypothetical protein